MAGYITGTVPKHSPKPWVLAHFAQYWPRIGDLAGSNVEYKRDMASYQLAQCQFPISAKFFADIALKEFWDSYVKVYMHFGDVLHVGKLAIGVTYDDQTYERLWVDGPPDCPLEYPHNWISVQALAYAIATDKASDRARAVRLLKRTRDDIEYWNEKYLRKRQNNARYRTRNATPDAPRDDRGNFVNTGAFYLS
jgi:hypothetical protein